MRENNIKTEKNNIDKSFSEIEKEKVEKLLNLIAKVIVEVTLIEYYENSNQISEVQ